MEALDLERLLARPTKKAPTPTQGGGIPNGRSYLTFDKDSDGKPILRNVTTTRTLFNDMVGAHEGKVGSMRRSRKGRSYRAPNGSRRYIRMSEEVLAYRA